MKTETPYTIATMLQQIGTGLSGGLPYVGASQLTYAYPTDAPRGCEYRSGSMSKVTPEGLIEAEVMLSFRVNTKRVLRVFVAYEPVDTYTVYLWRKANPVNGVAGKVLQTVPDVYCDMLQGVVEQLYDAYVREHQNGFIHI